ncbi:DUF2933 domain-containing protein [Aliidiomarina sp. Khilg15.8]
MGAKSENWTSLHGLVVLILVVASLYFLFVEHGSHVRPYLPYLILLLCPLMHIFMHKSHGGHKRNNTDTNLDDNEAYQRGLEDGKKQSAADSERQK